MKNRPTSQPPEDDDVYTELTPAWREDLKTRRRREKATVEDAEDILVSGIEDILASKAVVRDKIAFSIIKNYHGRATKRFELLPDGTLYKPHSGEIYEGSVRRCEVDDLTGFLAVRASLKSNQALCYGLTKKRNALIVTQDELANSPGAIARDRAHFHFAAGMPGILFVDHDPPPGKTYKAAELDDIITGAFPAIADVQRAWAPSNSAFLYDDEGRELIGKGGWRLYFAVDDAARIRDIGQKLYQALWRVGHGYVMITTAGSIRDKSLVDASVWQPERLDFSADPVLGKGLERRAPAPVILPGEPMLETARIKPPAKTMTEWRRVSGELKDARALKQAEAEEMRRGYIKTRVAQLKECGTYSNQSEAMLRTAIVDQVLLGGFELLTEKGHAVTVQQILSDPKRYDKSRFADPLEPGYGNDQRIAYANLGGDEKHIFSHAHGGTRYKLSENVGTIEIHAGARWKAVDETIDIMRGILYRRGKDVVCIHGSQIEPLNEHILSYTLNRNINYLALKKIDGEWKLSPIDTPMPVVREIIAKNFNSFPRLKHVITAPTLRADGSILNKPGFDAGTGLYLVGDDFPDIPMDPTEKELREACDVLWHAFHKYDFTSIDDKAVMFAALLTAPVRHLFGTAPGFMFDAPAAGSGKTKLGYCIQILCGEPSKARPVSDSDEEIRKVVLAMLQSGDRAILLDNIVNIFQSPAVAMMLTAPVYCDRRLQVSEELAFPTAVMLLLSANNATLGGDLFRRILVCRIDPQVENPSSREFKFDPEEHCTKNRFEMVRAALTLLRGYMAAGRPRDQNAKGTLGSFRDWERLIRQCVLWINQKGFAHLGDPIACVEKVRENDPDWEALKIFLNVVYGRYGANGWRARDLVADADLSKNLREILTTVAGAKHSLSQTDPRQLGKWIAGMREKRADGLRIVRGDKPKGSKKPVLWYIREDENKEETAPVKQSKTTVNGRAATLH